MNYKTENSLQNANQETLKDLAEKIAKEESPEGTASILHDLRVHQIELELQNESLRKTQADLDAIRFQYFEIFELAPVGYFILSKDNMIIEANLTSTTLLGVNKNELKGHRISKFITREDQDTFYLYTHRLSDAKVTQKCDIRMIRGDGEIFWAQFVGIPRQDINGETVYLNVVHDISDQKEIEGKLEEMKNIPSGIIA